MEESMSHADGEGKEARDDDERCMWIDNERRDVKERCISVVWGLNLTLGVLKVEER
jgi:hypothetical protein